MSAGLEVRRAPSARRLGEDALRVAHHLAAAHGSPTAVLVEHPPARHGRGLRRWRTEGLIIDVATSEDGCRRLRLEAGGRTWAEHNGVATPRLLDADPDGGWIVGPWVDARPSGGSSYVAACVATAALIASRPELPSVAADATSWRAAPHVRALRIARTLAGGVPPHLWLAARHQVESIEHPMEIAHGDFYPANLLRSAADEVLVVDWEYVGRAPRHTDLVRLWSVLHDPEDRARVLEVLLHDADTAERRRVGALVLWQALHLWGENLSAARRHRDAVTLSHARAVVSEAGLLARALGAVPR